MIFAGFWKRFVAAVIDSILLSIAYSAISAVFGVSTIFPVLGLIAGGDAMLAGAVASFVVIVMMLLFFSLVLSWLYFAIMESSHFQATLGKMALGIVVLNSSGARISFLQASGRYFGKFLSTIILYAGFIMAAFTKRKQALHDILADTYVINKP